MRFHIDKSMAALGIQHVVVGIARNVDPQATLSDSFLKKQREMEDWALRCDVDEVSSHPVIQGYKNLLQRVGRSVKRNPPHCSGAYPKRPASRLPTAHQQRYRHLQRRVTALAAGDRRARSR